MHIANLNPFRWKSFYWDGAQTNLYYVNGRYYDPCMGHFVDTDTPENLLFSASTINALDRNAISFYNTIEVTPNLDNIFPANELYADPTDENAGKSWWQINWKKALQWIAFAAAVIATVIVSIINPAVGAAMASLCIKGAISGLVIGGIIGGVISAAQGGNFWSGLTEGAIYGAINGYTAAAVMFGVSAGIKAIVNAANAAKPQILDPSDIRFSQNSANDVQPIIDSMKANGWKGKPMDVVRMSDGSLTTVDNSRLLAAKIINTPIRANVHAFNDPISFARANQIMKGAATASNAWGQAVAYRIADQTGKFGLIYPNGSFIIGWGGL